MKPTSNRKMSKLNIAAFAAAMGLGVDQIPALRVLRLTEEVEITPIPEEIRAKIENDTVAAAEAKRKRKLDKKKK